MIELLQKLCIIKMWLVFRELFNQYNVGQLQGDLLIVSSFNW